MGKIREYLDFFAECLLLAEHARTPDDRLRLLNMAARWKQLAGRLERWGDETPEMVLVQLRRTANGEPLN
jgi:hypothetical protein